MLVNDILKDTDALHGVATANDCDTKSCQVSACHANAGDLRYSTR